MSQSVVLQFIIMTRVVRLLTLVASYSCNLNDSKAHEAECFVRTVRKEGDGSTHVSIIPFWS